MRLLPALALTLVVVTAQRASAQVPADLRDAISARDLSLSSGAMTADTWDRLTAQNFTAVNPDGTLETKAEQLARLKSSPAPAGPPPPQLEEHVDVHGNAAVRRFKRSTDKSRGLEVWIKGSQGWQLAAVQYTPTK